MPIVNNNVLTVSVRLFGNLTTGKFSFGYVASDDYAEAFDDSWDSLEEFKKDFPDSNALVEHVTSQEGFYSEDSNHWGGFLIEYPH